MTRPLYQYKFYVSPPFPGGDVDVLQILLGEERRRLIIQIVFHWDYANIHKYYFTAGHYSVQWE